MSLSSSVAGWRLWLFAPLIDAIRDLAGRQEHAMTALENLTREVSEATTVQKAAAALLASLKARLDEAIATGDMTRVQALADELDASSNDLAAAVAANTPADTGSGGGDTGDGGDGSGDAGQEGAGDGSGDPDPAGERRQA